MVSKKLLHNSGYHDFLSKIFGITIPTNFVRNTFVFQNFSGMEKNQSSVGGCLEFWAKLFLAYSNEKIRRGDHCVSEILGYGKKYG